MFRATLEAVVDDGSVIRIAGHLTGEFLAEMERWCLSAEQPVVVDASSLRSTDEGGLALLARLRDSGVRVEGLSEYLEMRVRYWSEIEWEER